MTYTLRRKTSVKLGDMRWNTVKGKPADNLRGTEKPALTQPPVTTRVEGKKDDFIRKVQALLGQSNVSGGYYHPIARFDPTSTGVW